MSAVMTPYANNRAVLWAGDCLELLAAMPENSVDSIVTDPPYGLGFMGKGWDALPPGREWAEACLRVLKPGGHLLAFGGSRTWHRLAVAIEDGGFELRDSLAWLYGSGFPKSMDVSKAIDKLDAVEERLARAREFQAFVSAHLTAKRIDELTGTRMGNHFTTHPNQPSVATAELFDLLRPHLPEVPERIEELVQQRTVESQNFAAREVVGERTTGRGTGQGSVSVIGDSDNRDLTAAHTPEAQQWEGWGTALKPAFEPIVVARKPFPGTVAANVLAHGTGALNIDGCRIPHSSSADLATSQAKNPGRADTFSSGVYGSGRPQQRVNADGRFPTNVLLDDDQAAELDEQSAAASRFFYVAKAPKSERIVVDGIAHPTVKPLTLMRWLIRLVTPPGGLVLDTFAGSGTTGEAALLEGMCVLLAEAEPAYVPLIAARLARALQTLAGAA